MLSRALFEMTVTLKYILLDESGERYLRWREHDWVNRELMLKTVDSDNKELADQVKLNAKKAKEKYKYSSTYSWSDKSIKLMAKDVGLLEKWKTLYKMQCGMSHNDPRSIHHFLESHKDNVINTNNIKSDLWYIETALIAGFDNSLLILEIFAKEYELDINEKFEQLLYRVEGIINKD